MMKFFKTVNECVVEQETLDKGTWISLVNPGADEISFVSDALGINDDFLRAALDDEETSRIDTEPGQTLVIVDIPTSEKDGESEIYSTIPLGIIITADNIVTVCLKDSSVIQDVETGRVKNIRTDFKTRFVFQLLLMIAGRYLTYLRKISRLSSRIEHELYASLENEELIQLLALEKSLVYFSTSLKANEVTLQRIPRGRALKIYDEDKELLEDVLIEFHQAMEMTNIYSSILSGTMDAYASVISNNMNIIMKVLTLITIFMTIPEIVFSFYGMNVSGLPYPIFAVPIMISVVVIILVWFLLKKRNLY